ncbi:2-C-methyl-D-erythritol 4-phosphate cytidylyltransferase [Desulfuromonas versatilis]|uniref:2-C-methyl-D-erythritol 4-phosphate cytidylyltransferase n=1 Tax=Desulfuromonas versatilis TaxID=2802975 RepID=A0ABM8HYA7_9BACT|nr:2-C-methyl-D-erythritol 4-phosphate cytidylyltransferase [Desulfuromonas versatilis]BCR06969.1 2-C-methyl-D-erythritol 4-phosphate cytidylyltransferase [Desulfuromonas versatilis]
MNVTVLIPAAGMGNRMGAAVNKQYLALAGRPILAHTLALFERHPRVDHIYIISPTAEIDYCRSEIVARYGFAKVRQVVAGGAERQDSVRNGLEACGAAETDVVLIHDGVRPFFPPALLEPVVASAASVGGCVVGVPVKDTIKQVAAGRIEGTPDRRGLWQAQTPQAFRFGLILQAHRRALAEGFSGTDDASLFERLGLPVAMLEGSYRNIKITTPEDLVLARAFYADSAEGQS